jgi:hypothetical protein
MKCSKCGFDNKEDAIFCEKCDWKLDETYIPEMKVNRGIFSILALVFGAAGLVPVVLGTMGIAATILGAIGLVIGGYSFNYSRVMGSKNKNALMACSAIGLILSVIDFIYGFSTLV